MKTLTLLLLLVAIQQVPQPDPSGKQAEVAQRCLDVNTASKAELLTWEGMTPAGADTLIKASAATQKRPFVARQNRPFSPVKTNR